MTWKTWIYVHVTLKLRNFDITIEPLIFLHRETGRLANSNWHLIQTCSWCLGELDRKPPFFHSMTLASCNPSKNPSGWNRMVPARLIMRFEEPLLCVVKTPSRPFCYPLPQCVALLRSGAHFPCRLRAITTFFEQKGKTTSPRALLRDISCSFLVWILQHRLNSVRLPFRQTPQHFSVLI